MANPVGAISYAQGVNSTTQPAPAKPAVNVAKTTPQDSGNIRAAGRAAKRVNRSR
jgi:hypothetical protein